MQAQPLCTNRARRTNQGDSLSGPVSYPTAELLRTPRLMLTRIIPAWKESVGREVSRWHQSRPNRSHRVSTMRLLLTNPPYADRSCLMTLNPGNRALQRDVCLRVILYFQFPPSSSSSEYYSSRCHYYVTDQIGVCQINIFCCICQRLPSRKTDDKGCQQYYFPRSNC